MSEARDSAAVLAAPVDELDGVGPVRAARLARLGVRRVRDLLYLVPRRLDTATGALSVAQALEHVGSTVRLEGTLSPPSIFRQGRRRSVVRTKLADDSGSVGVLFFNQPWMRPRLFELVKAGQPVVLEGKLVETRTGPALATPRLGHAQEPLPSEGTIEPVYPLTSGLGQKLLRRLVGQALEYLDGVSDPLGAKLAGELSLPALNGALSTLHRPEDPEQHEDARRRVALERLLALQAQLQHARLGSRGREAPAVRVTEAEPELTAFEPTSAQRRTVGEIEADLARATPMRRLLQGDVGSGKTWVAMQAVRRSTRAGLQAAVMAPTELLAEQHAAGWIERFAALGVGAALLTGSVRGEERRRVLGGFADGSIQVAIGTHALFSETVRFKRLGLCIIDEQQRFGVTHKRDLLEKGRGVHVLLMTATPIPRTLALTIYCDLDVSVLDEAPPGRGEVRTHLVPEHKRERSTGFLSERLEAGERVFWVAPHIEPRAGEERTSAIEVHRSFEAGPLARFGIELVHGRMHAEERTRRLERFRSGAVGVLVGTSVLEVGIDVPEATVMGVEGARRFGLAQLHQLRGRIGRGPAPGWCLLFDADTPDGRLEVLAETRDGFRIAEEDLRRRGMGELAGLRQAGAWAADALDSDPGLWEAAHRLIKTHPDLARAYRDPETGAPELV